jgi:small subunit ribosomal protein S6
MLILPAEADEALVTTAVERITKVIEPSGGEVTKLDRWGRKRFAYEIDHQTEGYYVLVQFKAEPATQQELDRALKIADEVTGTRSCFANWPRKKKATASPPPRKA